ncbi:MAG: DUF2089 domain-containing protein [Deltaproteobacteria bacterium]|nr:DUF2089 domain-containing protein [Deltaproteobacteria bacterium]
MPIMPTHCPSCHEHLKVSHLICVGCGAQLEGSFDIHRILRLAPDEISFLLNFVQASGSLKEMAKIEGQSYPTIRNRLNELITKISASDQTAEEQRHVILDAISKGEISAREGAKQLAEVTP